MASKNSFIDTEKVDEILADFIQVIQKHHLSVLEQEFIFLQIQKSVDGYNRIKIENATMEEMRKMGGIN